MKKVENRMNNEGSIAQRGVESLVALSSTSIGVRNYAAFWRSRSDDVYDYVGPRCLWEN